MIAKTLQRFFAIFLALKKRAAELWDTPTKLYKQWLLLTAIKQEQDKLSMHLGRISANRAQNIQSVSSLNQTEFNVYSQSGEDGIIQYLISHIPDLEQKFIEIGTEDYVESNTRFLMANNLWQGLLVERDSNAVKKIHKSSWFWKYDLQVNNALVTAENVDEVIEKNSLSDDKLIIGGFSQGCMITLQAGITRKNKIKSIIGYSGKIIDRDYLDKNINSKPDIYLFHGDQDQIVLPEFLNESKKFLEKRNFNIKTKMFENCEHKIPREGANLGLDFIKNFF